MFPSELLPKNYGHMIQYYAEMLSRIAWAELLKILSVKLRLNHVKSSPRNLEIRFLIRREILCSKKVKNYANVLEGSRIFKTVQVRSVRVLSEN